MPKEIIKLIIRMYFRIQKHLQAYVYFIFVKLK